MILLNAIEPVVNALEGVEQYELLFVDFEQFVRICLCVECHLGINPIAPVGRDLQDHPLDCGHAGKDQVEVQFAGVVEAG